MRRDAVEHREMGLDILEGWSAYETKWLPEYPAGSWGPVDADRLIHAGGHHWRKNLTIPAVNLLAQTARREKSIPPLSTKPVQFSQQDWEPIELWNPGRNVDRWHMQLTHRSPTGSNGINR